MEAFPLMEEYAYKGSVFISTKYIGKKSAFCSHEDDKNYKMMEESDIIFLKEHGWFIGNHFHSHMNLNSLKILEVKEEYQKAKTILNNLLKEEKSSTIVAYPRARLNNQIQNILAEQKVSFAFSAGDELCKINEIERKKYDIPRISVFSSMDMRDFRLRLSPSYNKIKKFYKHLRYD